MNVRIERLPASDAAGSGRLASEAFGMAPVGAPAPAPAPEPHEPRDVQDPAPPTSWPPPNARPWGVWDDGELVAQATVRSFTSWFHGTRVATAGIAGVTVAAEHRGTGLVRPLLTAALAEARAAGDVISTLFPSSAGIYRGLGYETIGSVDSVRIPMSALASVRRPDGVRARRATADDLDVIETVYERWAREQNGPLTRAEEPFRTTADEIVGPAGTGTSLAVDPDGQVLGWARWSRGSGYDRTNTLQVEDLFALTPDAARALWRVLGSFSAVAGFVEVSSSGSWAGADPARLVLPDHAATTVSEPYMLRLLDVPGALGAARLAPLTVRVPFAVDDPSAPDLAGAWTLGVDDGAARVVPDDRPDGGSGPASDGRPTFTSAGLALSWAGAASTANLRLAGHVTGTSTHDATWDALWGGRQVHVRDDF